MAPTTFEAKVRDFLAQPRIAIAGVSRNSSEHAAGNLIYRRLKSSGHEMFPVNPHLRTFDGDPSPLPATTSAFASPSAFLTATRTPPRSAAFPATK